MRPILLLSAFVCAGFAQTSTPDYFPLQVGNEWLLESAGAPADPVHIEVQQSRTIDGQRYFLVTGYGVRDLWLRKSNDGSLLARDIATGNERKVAHLAFGAPQYSTDLSGCEQPARPAEVSVAVVGPQRPGLPVTYSSGQCRDVGIVQEIYGDGRGLTTRSVTTIAGPRTYNLVYARVGDTVYRGENGALTLRFDFRSGSKGWLAGFSDYDLNHSDLRMLAEVRSLPEELNSPGTGFYLQSMNRSDDLFMYLKKEISSVHGLEPNRYYNISFDLEFASDAGSGCVGVGGAPGESVYLKAGATVDEPLSVLNSFRHLTMTLDKGFQSTGGRDAGVAGNIANGGTCGGDGSPYVRLRKTYVHPRSVRTDDRGVLWLMVGTDSGYEGLTGLYYTSITACLRPTVSPTGTGGAQ